MYFVRCSRCEQDLVGEHFETYDAAAEAARKFGHFVGDDKFWCSECVAVSRADQRAYNGSVVSSIVRPREGTGH